MAYDVVWYRNQTVMATLVAMLGLSIVALIICITVGIITGADRENAVRTACIEKGGDLGEHNGWVTCTLPK